ncbi:hypothetical protein SDC9_173502 [bioreactor metagenome]|uniref:Uncharacterized protein n=1 Tax=bioreactor metagenome TaxID=1076179 RepID=A0A645GIV5_9ZZZZ
MSLSVQVGYLIGCHAGRARKSIVLFSSLYPMTASLGSLSRISTILSSVSLTRPFFSSSSAFSQSSSANSCSACDLRSSANTLLTRSSFIANSLIAENDGSLPMGVSSGHLSSRSRNRWSRTRSKAFSSLPHAGSVAWWLYANFPS